MTEKRSDVFDSFADIQITPEMIEAGKAAFFPSTVANWLDEAEVLARVYRAMASVRPSHVRQSGP